MSDINTIVKKTTDNLINLAEKTLNEAIAKKGESTHLGFEGTAFFLPLTFALTGLEVKDLKSASKLIESAKFLSEGKTLESGMELPYLDGLLSKGMAVLLVEELLASLLHNPQEGYLGFVPDTVLR
ncbi:MAG TPA: hypothetical protein PLU24_04100, partial [Candidatus Omnitrophota bacterium]|nr:hypothetical protein [Candidatus Omnitrophota bacterium]